jgi:ferredoxin
MRVHADREICAGNAYCTVAAPEVFDLDIQDGLVQVLVETPSDAQVVDVESAVTQCPVGALRLDRAG